MSTMSSLVDEESPHSDNLVGDTGTLAQSLLDLNAISCAHWNLLFSASNYSTDFGVEELDGGAAKEMNEFDDIMCSHESYMQHVKSVTVAVHEGEEGFYDNTQQVNWIICMIWIHQVDYLHIWIHEIKCVVAKLVTVGIRKGIVIAVYSHGRYGLPQTDPIGHVINHNSQYAYS